MGWWNNVFRRTTTMTHLSRTTEFMRVEGNGLTCNMFLLAKCYRTWEGPRVTDTVHERRFESLIVCCSKMSLFCFPILFLLVKYEFEQKDANENIWLILHSRKKKKEQKYVFEQKDPFSATMRKKEEEERYLAHSSL